MTGVPSASQGLSGEKLLERLQKNDPDAFRLLFEKHYNTVLAYSVGFLGDQSHAEDVAQEVFFKVHEHAVNIKNPGKFKSWLLSLTRNMNIDYFRKKKQRKEISISQQDFLDTLSQTEPEMVIEQAFDTLTEAHDLPILSSLNATQREIVILRIVEGMSYQEISEITGLTPENIRKIMSRTLEKLQEKGA